MNKRQVLKAFQHGHALTLELPEYRDSVLAFLTWQLFQDRRQRDVTAESLFADDPRLLTLELVAEEDGVAAGLEELSPLSRSQKISLVQHVADGGPVNAGRVVAEMTGNVGRILEAERVALDLVGRMSGIATATRRLGEKIQGLALVAGTRKTLWGLLDKKAVYLGGGLTHRLGLWQAILIKDNHLAALRKQGCSNPVEEALRRAAEHARLKESAFLEIEVESREDALTAFQFLEKEEHGIPTALLLDNFSPDSLRELVARLKPREKVILEASGGITEENAREYASTGVDLISVGNLTHSARMLNYSARVQVSRSVGIP